MAKLNDLTGRVFGRLTVVAQGLSGRNRMPHWWCACACGSSAKLIRADHLRSGNTTSCGCAARERVTKHGLSSRPLYQTWLNARTRTTNPRSPHWPRYGGRGIRMCAEWRDSFEAFLRDMGPSYVPGLTLDRANVDGHYEPGNCRWITHAEQQRNRRDNVYVQTEAGVMLREDAIRQYGRRGAFNPGGSARLDSQPVAA